MPPKSKKCKRAECDKVFLQYNSLKAYCSPQCQKAAGKQVKPPKPVSDKRKVENKLYSALRTDFLNLPENHRCPISGQPTTEVHHTFSGKDRSKYYLDTSTWLAVSRDGHNWIHDNPKESRELGYLK